MHTLAEIEAAIGDLAMADVEILEARIHAMKLARRDAGKTFTGRDAIAWWRNRERMDLEDAEAFGNDVEAGRREVSTPPRVIEWE